MVSSVIYRVIIDDYLPNRRQLLRAHRVLQESHSSFLLISRKTCNKSFDGDYIFKYR